MEERQEKEKTTARLEAFHDGRDEMNLAEFPLSAICNRFLDGTKTVVFSDQVWDEGKKEHVPRSLTISGSDRYGLPTAKDDDVLLGCIQLSSIGDFHSREVNFSRYELLKLLRWRDETKNYRRLATSLRRWKGVTVYSDRAFYDKARKSWVNRDFGILDNLYIYEREESEGRRAPASSWFVWNEVLFESFQSGYLKKLDWDLYCRLEDPVAKRLYRLLDKRFYRRDEIVFDLHELAFNKVRVGQNYDTAQVKRALLSGIRELEALWDLRPLPPEERFRRVGPGKWEAVFSRKPKRVSKSKPAQPERNPLEDELVSRQVVHEVARELVGSHDAEKIRSMIELHDWYRKHGQAKGPGFLVSSIKSETGYVLPTELRNHSSKPERAQKARKCASREYPSAGRGTTMRSEEKTEEGAFLALWTGLGEKARQAFEEQAVASAEPTKRDGYHRSLGEGGVLFEQYRFVILRDHFRALQAQPGGLLSEGQSAA